MDAPELVPLEDYDSPKAKLCASISWVLTKAYGADVPPPFRKPFFEDSQGEIQLTPSMVNGLISAEVYCKACASIFREPTLNWKGHFSVIQSLSRQGIFLMDVNESAVTDTLLQQNNPFKLSSHLTLIDGLMSACVSSLAPIERVVAAVRRFAPSFSASAELPIDAEDALLFWLNKVGAVVRGKLERQAERDSETRSRMPVNKQPELASVPVMDDLMKDLNDGCCLAATISFYCPDALKLTDIALKESLGIADSLYNLQLIMEFCQQKLPAPILHLTLNDLFYTHAELRCNILVFLAELFGVLEVNPISCVRDVTRNAASAILENVDEEGNLPSPTKKGMNAPPISNATKRSFQRPASGMEQANSTPDLTGQGLGSRQPLLPRRLNQQQNNGRSETNAATEQQQQQEEWPFTHLPLRGHVNPGGGGGGCADNNSVPPSAAGVVVMDNIGGRGNHHMVEEDDDEEDGWADTPDGRKVQPEPEEDDGRGNSHMTGSAALLGNVSIDSEMDMSTDSSVNVSTEFDDTPRFLSRPIGPIRRHRSPTGITDPHHPDYMELESVGSTAPNTHRSVGNPHPGNPHSGNPHSGNPHPSEPLMPAQLRPAKEKSNNHHTKEVESGEKMEKRSPQSPSKKSNPRSLNFGSKTTAQAGYVSQNMGGNSSGESTPSEEYQTPSVESVPFVGGGNSPKKDSSKAGNSQEPAEGEPDQEVGKPFEAFYVDNQPPVRGVPSPVMQHNRFVRGDIVGQSFTLHDRAKTPQSARAAGIPVVETPPSQRRSGGRGTPASGSRSGGGQPDTGQQRQTVAQRPQDLRSRPRELSPRSIGSSDGSDQELRKIHADHRDKEHKGPVRDPVRESFFLNSDTGSEGEAPERPASLNVPKPIKVAHPRGKESPKTSFAQLRQQQLNQKAAAASGAGAQNGEVSTTGFSLHQPSSSKTDRNSPKIPKKTTFGAMPNQTTWQETAQVKMVISSEDVADSDTVQPLASELINLRMQLEERRRQIEDEKRRKEAQWGEVKQKMGKEAFMTVIQKGKDPEAEEKDNRRRSGSGQDAGRLKARSGNSTPEAGELQQPPSRTRSSPDIRDQVAAQKASSRSNRQASPERTPTSAPTSARRHKTSPQKDHHRSNNKHEPPRHYASREELAYAESKLLSPDRPEQYEPYEPAKQRRESEGDDSAAAHKPFSRKDIQETIDNVKQRWFSGNNADNAAKPGDITFQKRPASYHEAAGTSRLAPEDSPRNSPKDFNSSHRDSPRDFHHHSQRESSRDREPVRDMSSSHRDSPTSSHHYRESPSRGRPVSMNVDQHMELDAVRSMSSSLVEGSDSPQQNAAMMSSSAEAVPTPKKSHLSGDKQKVAGAYPTSLEKLNSSLSDLQGEIMRLTLQQDAAIKGMVHPSNSQDPETSSASPKHHPAAAATSYSTPMYAPTPPPPPHMAHGAPGYHGYGPPPPQPAYSGGFPPHTMQGFYPPQYQGSPMYQYGGAQQYGPHPGQWGAPQPYAPPPGVSSYNQHPAPAAPAAFQPSPTSPFTEPGLSVAMSPGNSGAGLLHSPANNQSSMSASGPVLMSPSSPTPASPAPAPQTTTGANMGEHQPTDSSEIEDPAEGEGDTGDLDVSTSPEPAREGDTGGFFIAFESGTPKRQKPALGKNRPRKGESPARPVKNGAGSPRTADNGSTTPKKKADALPPPEVLRPVPPEPVSPGVGFVVGVDEADLPPVGTEMSELELKKKRMLEAMMKRKQQSAEKAAKAEAKRQKKREEQQQKQEIMEQRKADEKAKRETIYQEYLKRKAERENAEEDSKAGIHPPVKKREPKRNPSGGPKGLRPKSQPVIDKDCYSGGSTSSQEDLRAAAMNQASSASAMRGANSAFIFPPPPSLTDFTSPPTHQSALGRAGSSYRAATPAKNHNVPSHTSAAGGNGDIVDGGQASYAGGATHRRPPSPEKAGPRYVPERDSGPKLYVKPSQKSNRHIIINAISHCCLAGSVNNPVKHKVLEELAKSDAKHFVILFRDAQQQYRGLYSYNPDTDDIYKIQGVGPRQLTAKMMERFYKYNSGGKNFTQITTTKHMSATIDAVTIQSALWQKKPAAKKPPQNVY